MSKFKCEVTLRFTDPSCPEGRFMCDVVKGELLFDIEQGLKTTVVDAVRVHERFIQGIPMLAQQVRVKSTGKLAYVVAIDHGCLTASVAPVGLSLDEQRFWSRNVCWEDLDLKV